MQRVQKDRHGHDQRLSTIGVSIMTQFEDRIRASASDKPTRPYLVILPASGHVRKMTGKFIFVEIGGETKWSPMIFNGTQAIALDPRCLVVQANDPSKIEYHPREVMDKIHPAAVRWLNNNPGVFVKDVASGIIEVGHVS